MSIQSLRSSFQRHAAWMFCALLLTACSGGVQGKYSHEEAIPGAGKAKMTLELKGDHKAVMTMSGDDMGSASQEGTYEVDGNKISVSISGDTQVFTRDGSKLISKGFGETIELEKE
jgi:hypothetical protein